MKEFGFVDYLNPTNEEIHAWAYTPDVYAPDLDWDIIISTIKEDRLYLTLANDPKCPTSLFFLSLLYLIVGNAVRTNYFSRTRKEIEDLIGAAGHTDNPKLKRLVERARVLISNPASFDYHSWAGGGFAHDG
jgi:hypothetical protein